MQYRVIGQFLDEDIYRSNMGDIMLSVNVEHVKVLLEGLRNITIYYNGKK